MASSNRVGGIGKGLEILISCLGFRRRASLRCQLLEVSYVDEIQSYARSF